LRREKWLKRVAEIKESDKVKIKQLETLVKDAGH
jgi:hypothetical protein